MKSKTLQRLGLAVLWAASLMLVAQRGHTQIPNTNPPTPIGAIISGNDVGFRYDGLIPGGVTGVWMVKVNGTWSPVTSSVGARPLTAK